MRITVSVLLLAAVVHAVEVKTYPENDGENSGKIEKRVLRESYAGKHQREPYFTAIRAKVSSGIEYADSKEDLSDRSPSHQLYASHAQIEKISDLLTDHEPSYHEAIANHLYSPVSAYQARLSPTYEISSPIASKLAYSEHEIYRAQDSDGEQAVRPQKKKNKQKTRKEKPKSKSREEPKEEGNDDEYHPRPYYPEHDHDREQHHDHHHGLDHHHDIDHHHDLAHHDLAHHYGLDHHHLHRQYAQHQLAYAPEAVQYLPQHHGAIQLIPRPVVPLPYIPRPGALPYIGRPDLALPYIGNPGVGLPFIARPGLPLIPRPAGVVPLIHGPEGPIRYASRSSYPIQYIQSGQQLVQPQISVSPHGQLIPLVPQTAVAVENQGRLQEQQNHQTQVASEQAVQAKQGQQVTTAQSFNPQPQIAVAPDGTLIQLIPQPVDTQGRFLDASQPINAQSEQVRLQGQQVLAPGQAFSPQPQVAITPDGTLVQLIPQPGLDTQDLNQQAQVANVQAHGQQTSASAQIQSQGPVSYARFSQGQSSPVFAPQQPTQQTQYQNQQNQIQTQPQGQIQAQQPFLIQNPQGQFQVQEPQLQLQPQQPVQFIGSTPQPQFQTQQPEVQFAGPTSLPQFEGQQQQVLGQPQPQFQAQEPQSQFQDQQSQPQSEFQAQSSQFQNLNPQNLIQSQKPHSDFQNQFLGTQSEFQFQIQQQQPQFEGQDVQSQNQQPNNQQFFRGQLPQSQLQSQQQQPSQKNFRDQQSQSQFQTQGQQSQFNNQQPQNFIQSQQPKSEVQNQSSTIQQQLNQDKFQSQLPSFQPQQQQGRFSDNQNTEIQNKQPFQTQPLQVQFPTQQPQSQFQSQFLTQQPEDQFSTQQPQIQFSTQQTQVQFSTQQPKLQNQYQTQTLTSKPKLDTEYLPATTPAPQQKSQADLERSRSLLLSQPRRPFLPRTTLRPQIKDLSLNKRKPLPTLTRLPSWSKINPTTESVAKIEPQSQELTQPQQPTQQPTQLPIQLSTQQSFVQPQPFQQQQPSLPQEFRSANAQQNQGQLQTAQTESTTATIVESKEEEYAQTGPNPESEALLQTHDQALFVQKQPYNLQPIASPTFPTVQYFGPQAEAIFGGYS